MSSASATVEGLLKSRVCNKKQFPYGDNEGVTFYDPSCIEEMYTCQDYCGKKCVKNCNINHDSECPRGTVPSNFLYCPLREEKDKTSSIPYVHYELVEDSNIKEGKKAYKRTEKITEDKNANDFLKEFSSGFSQFAKHKLEYWFLSTVKTASSSSKSQHKNTMFAISDFAQNIKLSSKKETSEEYFHQKQIAVFGTVSTINVPGPENTGQQHSLSQITSSDNKCVTYKHKFQK